MEKPPSLPAEASPSLPEGTKYDRKEWVPALVDATADDRHAEVADEAAGHDLLISFPIVGIVASAGGLDAFKKFFSAMPADSGMAFVLIPHLDPSHESLMVELLSKSTTMPVVEAKHDMAVQVNSVYIIPPSSFLSISGGLLQRTCSKSR